MKLIAGVRAYEPAPGCWTLSPDGQRFRIRSVSLADGAAPDLACGQVAVEQGAIICWLCRPANHC